MRVRQLVPAVVSALLVSGNAVAQFQLPLPPHATPEAAFHIYSPVCAVERGDTAKALRLFGDDATIEQLEALPRYTVRIPGVSDTIRVTARNCRTRLSQGERIGSEGSLVAARPAALHRLVSVPAR